MNKTQTPAVCEICLQNGSMCGIAAIGRCTTCGKAFCLTHQGRAYGGFQGWITYVDMCASCLLVRQAEDAKRSEEAFAPERYFKSDAARTDLLSSGVPPIEIYSIGSRQENKWGLLGRRYSQVEVANLFGRGWILGEFEWHYNITINIGGPNESRKVAERWLTALLDVSFDDPLVSSRRWANGTLFRVRPYSKGYEMVGFGSNDRFESDTSEYWREAMQAVKRLIGG